jgi:hypothetical protein
VKIGGLGDCVCEAEGGAIKVPVARGAAPIAVKKPRKPRSKGKGSHCVISHKGKTVHCYEKEATAKRVAKAFTEKGRAGSSFHVETRTKD